MSLTASDLLGIRNIVKEEIEPVRGDIKRMASIESKFMNPSEFEKLSLEQKILKLNTELIAAAKQAGVSLPR